MCVCVCFVVVGFFFLLLLLFFVCLFVFRSFQVKFFSNLSLCVCRFRNSLSQSQRLNDEVHFIRFKMDVSNIILLRIFGGGLTPPDLLYRIC